MTVQPRLDRVTLLLGGGSGVAEDVRELLQLMGTDDPSDVGTIVAVNEIGAFWPKRLDHWVTLHPEKLRTPFGWDPVPGLEACGGWEGLRAYFQYPEPGMIWTHARKSAQYGAEGLLPQWGRGGSGLFALQVAAHLKCERVVLCGMPMTPTPHFMESPNHTPGRKWGGCTAHQGAWLDNLPHLRTFVRSMSGWTGKHLGPPDQAWLR